MTDLVPCTACGHSFLVPPEPCPACGAPAPPQAASVEGQGRDVIISSRLNRTAQVGGVLLAGLVTGSLSWFLFAREMGVVLLLMALVIAGAMLWRP
ncbi:MAG: hypothetical protein EA421_10915 [Gemmatimonadales bacterium]|nr:MAG: hypothetical protein EA421_10915 [Gemmatimonadales bacterium]